MKTQYFLLPSTLLLAAACSSTGYLSPELTTRTSRHQVIAVLPFEVLMAGKPPGGITSVQLARAEENDSVAFQTALYASLLDQASGSRKHPIRVRIQPADETNRLLEQNGIGIRESWGMSAKSLARVLRVDAVVSTTVHTMRYLSSSESFAIETGLVVVNEISEGRLAPFLPWSLSTTADIGANCELIDTLDGTVIWQSDMSAATDWRAPPKQIISDFTNDLAKRFPYRG